MNNNLFLQLGIKVVTMFQTETRNIESAGPSKIVQCITNSWTTEGLVILCKQHCQTRRKDCNGGVPRERPNLDHLSSQQEEVS